MVRRSSSVDALVLMLSVPAVGGPDEVRAALGEAAVVRGVRGTHSFTKDPVDVLAEARAWLSGLDRSG